MARGPEGREDGELGLWGYRQEGGLRGGRAGDCGDSKLTKKLWVQPGGAAHSGPMGRPGLPLSVTLGTALSRLVPNATVYTAYTARRNASRDPGREMGWMEASPQMPGLASQRCCSESGHRGQPVGPQKSGGLVCILPTR